MSRLVSAATCKRVVRPGLVKLSSFSGVIKCECDAAMQARIDHKNGTVHFGGLDVESDQLRDHISSLTSRLTKAVALIHKAQDPEKEARRLKVRSTSQAAGLIPQG